MADYQLAANDCVIRNLDGACIPPDMANRDYAEFQAWHAAGGVPDPYVPPPPEPATMDANARLDAGIAAALDVAVAVKDAMANIPDAFSNARFTQMKIQMDALTEAFVQMLQAQNEPPP